MRTKIKFIIFIFIVLYSNKISCQVDPFMPVNYISKKVDFWQFTQFENKDNFFRDSIIFNHEIIYYSIVSSLNYKERFIFSKTDSQFYFKQFNNSNQLVFEGYCSLVALNSSFINDSSSKLNNDPFAKNANEFINDLYRLVKNGHSSQFISNDYKHSGLYSFGKKDGVWYESLKTPSNWSLTNKIFIYNNDTLKLTDTINAIQKSKTISQDDIAKFWLLIERASYKIKKKSYYVFSSLGDFCISPDASYFDFKINGELKSRILYQKEKGISISQGNIWELINNEIVIHGAKEQKLKIVYFGDNTMILESK